MGHSAPPRPQDQGNTGSSYPKGRPKKIHSFNHMLSLPGLLARVHPALGLLTGPVGTLPPSALTLSRERGVQGAQDRDQEGADPAETGLGS